MRTTYKYLAYAICLLIVAQASFVVYADAGLFKWISEDGGVLDKAFIDDESSTFPGLGGFIAHGMNGMMVIPLVAIVTLVVSFFTKVKGASIHGGAIVGLVALQITLGLVAHSIPAIGPLHGINAFVLFLTALHAARLMSSPAAAAAPTVGKDSAIPGQSDHASSQQLQA